MGDATELVPDRDALAAAYDDSENESLRILCEVNGLSKDKFAKSAHKVTALDAFQSPLRELSGCRFFPNLVELCVMQQRAVDEIVGLEECFQLESLWISECNLWRISGLDGCRKLRKLYLHCNQLTRIEGLSHLRDLEVLWLAENQIPAIENLDALQSLRVLWLARNRITAIGSALDALVSLEELNLADNRIGFFREVRNLARLPHLRSVCFSDPHYGDNPVCNLCNYQTYCLFQLRQLAVLDTMVLSEESKAMAEATYMKKRMYYNMRIKTLKRNTTNVIRAAREAKQARASHTSLNLNVLLRQKKDIEREVDEAVWLPAAPGADPSSERGAQLKAKHDALDQAVTERTSALAAMHRSFEALKDEAVEVGEENISRLIVELETGGNIRLEDGTPSDVWYASCANLLRSRMFASDFQRFGIADVRVTRVTRVHNRFLRNRFERRLHALLGAAGEQEAGDAQSTPGGTASGASSAPPLKASATPAAKRSLEYLFFCELPRLSRAVGAANEVFRLIEDGFRTPDEYRALGLGASIRLTNSLAAADLPRIRAYLNAHAQRQRERRAQKGGREPARQAFPDPPEEPWDAEEPLEKDTRAVAAAVRALEDGDLRLPPGHAVISKVFLGTCVPEDPAATAAARQSPDEEVAHPVHHDDYDGAQTVYRTCPTDPKQREWFVLDNAVALPEYLVEYEYVTVAEKEREDLWKAMGSMHAATAAAAASSSATDDSDTGSDTAATTPTGSGDEDDAGARGQSGSEPGGGAGRKGRRGKKGEVAEADAPRKGEKKSAPPEPLEQAAELLGLEHVERSLLAAALRAVLTGGQERVKSTAAAQAPPALPSSTSGGAAAEGGAAVPKLAEQEALDLGPLLRPLLRFLREVRLPEAKGGPYEEECARLLALPPSVEVPPKLFVMDTASVLERARAGAPPDIMYLNLHGNALRRVEGLGSCVHLRVLVLSFNEIQRMEGLSALRSLERLELGYNLIRRIEGLEGLSSLRHLELHNNLLFRLEDVHEVARHCPGLRQLDLRGNAICDLKSYHAMVLRALPALQVFDGARVTEEDREEAGEDVVAITEDLVKECASGGALGAAGIMAAGTGVASGVRKTEQPQLFALRKDSSGTFALQLPPGAPLSSLRRRVPGGAAAAQNGEVAPAVAEDAARDSDEEEGEEGAVWNGGESHPESASDADEDATSGGGSGGVDSGGRSLATWWEQVDSLDLSHRRLRRLQNLHRLTRLRRASFADNELARIEGLEHCVSLEELSLEENRILKMEGLERLTHLRKLDLGKNKLTHIEGLATLIRLTQLSLEDNEISSLDGLRHLTSLMELYIGNNHVAALKEAQMLKQLPKLIILDLSGNPMCLQPQYRLYCVYYLRKLKVLDGIGVDQGEQQAAREQYSGKLTAEFLADKIGHKYFEHIRELDLSSCRVRLIEALSGREFCNLRELNLDHNMLSSLRGLRALSLLTVLRLNHNRIESLALGPEGEEDPEGIASMPNLEVLQLGHNRIATPTALNFHVVPNLRVLYLQHNEISRLEGMSCLSHLRELVLDKNKIKALDSNSLQGLLSLQELRIEENGLRSLQHISDLPSLHTLFLGYNRLSDLGEIEHLHSLPRLAEIALNNNSVARKQMYRATVLRRLPHVRVIDGREVMPDERERVELMFMTPADMVQGPGGAQGPYAAMGVTTAAGGVGPGGAGVRGPAVTGAPDIRGGGRLPVRLASVGFDSAPGGGGGGGAGGMPQPPTGSAAGPAMSVTSLAIGPGAGGGAPVVTVGGGSSNQYSHSWASGPAAGGAAVSGVGLIGGRGRQSFGGGGDGGHRRAVPPPSSGSFSRGYGGAHAAHPPGVSVGGALGAGLSAMRRRGNYPGRPAPPRGSYAR